MKEKVIKLFKILLMIVFFVGTIFTISAVFNNVLGDEYMTIAFVMSITLGILRGVLKTILEIVDLKRKQKNKVLSMAHIWVYSLILIGMSFINIRLAVGIAVVDISASIILYIIKSIYVIYKENRFINEEEFSSILKLY